MNTSDKGIALIKRLEGCSTVAYRDVAGLLTIGVGHLLTRSELMSGKILIDGKLVKWGDGLTGDQCDDLLRQDLGWAEQAVRGLVNRPLTQHQFDALVSFAFNVGTEAFRNSTLLRLLNQGQYDAVPAQLARWTKAAGREVLGLKNRRVWEIKMWGGLA